MIINSTHSSHSFFIFFFNDPATTEIYTLSLHDALPIWSSTTGLRTGSVILGWPCNWGSGGTRRDRKSTRLNSSHSSISYAVFCLKKKKKEDYEVGRMKRKQQDSE